MPAKLAPAAQGMVTILLATSNAAPSTAMSSRTNVSPKIARACAKSDMFIGTMSPAECVRRRVGKRRALQNGGLPRSSLARGVRRIEQPDFVHTHPRPTEAHGSCVAAMHAGGVRAGRIV